MESRTKPFEVQTDYQKEVEREAGYDFAVAKHTQDQLEIVCTPLPGVVGMPFKATYTLVLYPAKSEMVIHAAVRELAGIKYECWSTVFSYKASVRMADVSPWVGQRREEHASKARQAGFPEKAMHALASHQMKLVWPAIKRGVLIKHAKQTRAKNDKDGSLFDIDEV